MSNTINYSNGGLTVTQNLNGLTSSSTTTMDGGGKYHVTSANPDGTSEIDSYVSGLLVQSQQMGTNNTQTSSTSYDYNPNETLKDSQTTINGILQTTNYTEFQDGTQASVQLPGQAQPQTVTAINSSTEDPTSVTNPNNSTSSQSENTLGQTTQQSGAGIIASEYGYNADGQLTTLTTFPSGSVGSDYENAATTTWDYDPATGLMSSKTYNDGTSDQYKYNAAGQLATVIEPGMSESVGYDSAGQQTSYTAIDSQTGLVSSQVMAEDDQGRAMSTVSVDDGQVTTETNSYTALGQPQTESFGAAGNVTVAHSYYPTAPGQNDPNPQNESPDALASMTIQNLPNGQANAQTTYGYDPTSKRLQTITVNGVTFTIAYVSGSTSQIGSITTSVAGQAGSAVTTTLTPYSGANGNASMLGGISVTASGSTLYNATLGYNTNGQIATDNITSTNTSGASQTNDYAYTYGSGRNDNGEDANSLTEVTDNGNTTETYSYDGVGNFTDSSLGAVNALNQYAALSYNLRGDVTNDGTYAYMYDANDRMISVTPDDPDATGAQKLTYGYDSQGRRIWKNVYTWDDANDSWDFDYSRSYVYDGTQLVGELNTTGQLVTGYTWSPSGQLLAVTDYTQATPKTYVAVIDASGNTAMLVDPTNGTVAASYTYDSYGNLLSATGPAQAICSILGKGLYYDIEARSIGHALDRDIRNNIWYERDPAGEVAGGANLYQYLGGDPIDLSDTNGTAALPTQEENNARSPLIAQAKLYMELIYGKNASDLLLAYENSGNIITTASSKGFFWDSKQSNLTNYLHATSQDTITLLNGISPAEAATELYARLTEAAGHGYNGMRDEMLFHLTVVRNSINPDLVLQSYQTGIQQGAQMASTLGSLYYGGFSIAGGEGANLVLSLDDARQGHWLGAMLTLLPVVAPLLAKTGGKLLIRGSRIGELDSAAVQRLIRIGCFAAGTLVATEAGRRPIESIAAQERVWAFEPATGAWRLMPVVVPIQVDFQGEFVTLQVGGATIEATAAHPFWVVAGEGLEGRPAPDNISQTELKTSGPGRWVQAIHLRVGDVLQTRTHGTTPITALSREFREQRVYNLWVDEIHTYAVSSAEVVAHNSDCPEQLIQLTVKGEAVGNAAENTAANVVERQPLDWSRVNPAGESAYEHVQLHGADDLSKPVQGVFNNDPVLTAQEAWTKAQLNGIQPVAQGARDVYTVPMGRAVGIQGGSAGSGSPLTNVVIVVQRSTNQVVTAFPK